MVLQEQSTLPIKNAERFHENVRLFDEPIKAAGAKMVLYMTWARQNAPDSQKALTAAYTSIGKELGRIVVPVGVAWQKYLAKHDEPVLHDRDKSHPSLAGTFLAACVFIGSLFNENPLRYDCDVAGLEKEDRARLEKLAWQVCWHQFSAVLVPVLLAVVLGGRREIMNVQWQVVAKRQHEQSGNSYTGLVFPVPVM